MTTYTSPVSIFILSTLSSCRPCLRRHSRQLQTARDPFGRSPSSGSSAAAPLRYHFSLEKGPSATTSPSDNQVFDPFSSPAQPAKQGRSSWPPPDAIAPQTPPTVSPSPSSSSSSSSRSSLESQLSYHWDTTPPTPAQLQAAHRFFLKRPAKFLTSNPKFRTLAHANAPEVAFLGRSNVGKSTLLNALLNGSICHTSSKPGRTRTMNAIEVNGGRLVVLDMPGHGHGSRDEWGTEILKYLSNRKALRRAFLLIDPSHGVKRSDEQLLALFRTHAIPHQILLSKADRILTATRSRKPHPDAQAAKLAELRAIMEDLRPVVQPPPGRAAAGVPGLGEIIACAAVRNPSRGLDLLGMGAVRWAVLAATGLDAWALAEHKRKPWAEDMVVAPVSAAKADGRVEGGHAAYVDGARG